MNKFDHVKGWKPRIDKGEAIAIIWDIDDVIGVAKQQKIQLTKEEAKEILAIIHRHHDANEGINWIVIEAAIGAYQLC